jgi:hypothetical protein
MAEREGRGWGASVIAGTGNLISVIQRVGAFN